MAATKHFFHNTSGVVALGLESLVSRNNHLALDVPNKVVYSKTASPSKVSIISGGGSGHEPAWSGYVGDGMLAAAVNGEVFASPSTKQVMAAIEHVPSEAGIILCITNYTGDNLHFGLAREKAVGMGYKIGMLRMTDDVGLGRKQTENTGRRGLAGNMFVLKLCGAASDKGWDFDKCLRLGQSVNDHCVTIGSSLDYCHIPGRAHHESLPPDTYSVAQGIHNEAGLKEVSPIPNAREMISNLLTYLLSPTDADRSFVSFSSSAKTALLINNFGGVSNFELEALTSTTLSLLRDEWSIKPLRTLAQCFESSLNAPGWSISLLNLDGISEKVGISVDELLAFLDADTNAPAWPKNGYKNVEEVDRSAFCKGGNGTTGKVTSGHAAHAGPKIHGQTLEHALRKACQATISAEPDITKWDIQMGDGDCGEAVSAICSSIMSELDKRLCSPSTATNNGAGGTELGIENDGKVPFFPVLETIENCIEEVGGTLGAIIAIFVASFGSNLQLLLSETQGQGITSRSLAEAAHRAMQNLQSYTPARVGGRTVMDTLIPFCETLCSSGGDIKAASHAAERGARATEGMSAKFGRASYVGDGGGEKTHVPMDPGAWAAAVFLKALAQGFEEAE